MIEFKMSKNQHCAEQCHDNISGPAGWRYSKGSSINDVDVLPLQGEDIQSNI